MSFAITRGDITGIPADAIIYSANTRLRAGSGESLEIFRAAGMGAIRAACDALAPVQVGEAAVTPGFALPAQHIIHAVCPAYPRLRAGKGERGLRAAYTCALQRAEELGCEQVACVLPAGGLFGYRQADALRVVVAAIHAFLAHHDLEVTLVVADRADVARSEALLRAVGRYVAAHYVAPLPPPGARAAAPAMRRPPKRKRNAGDFAAYEAEDEFLPHYAREDAAAPALRERFFGDAGDAAPAAASLESRIQALDEPFSQTLLRMIDARGETDAAVYRRANIDRKLFSKIRTGNGYMPGKRTVLALAIALRLTLPETRDFLALAGYALSPSQKFDVIVEYFILHGLYDIFAINEVLFHYDQPLLGK